MMPTVMITIPLARESVNTESDIKPVPVPCISQSAKAKMRPGFPCWKRHTPRSMAITMPFRVVTLAKELRI